MVSNETKHLEDHHHFKFKTAQNSKNFKRLKTVIIISVNDRIESRQPRILRKERVLTVQLFYLSSFMLIKIIILFAKFKKHGP